ncbi:hypothetical protein ACLBWT_08150 [Paenibacillus sp. D51F]
MNNGYTLFHSDIFRHRTVSLSNVVYKDGLSLDNDRFVNLRIGQLMESILYYDSVFIEHLELPVVVRFLRNKDALLETVIKGHLSIVDVGKSHIGAVKHNHIYTLAKVHRPTHINIKEQGDIDHLIMSPGWAGDFSGLSKPLFETMKTITPSLIDNIMVGIESDFQDRSLSSRLSLSSRTPKTFFSNDAKIVNRLSETYFRTTVCNDLDITNVFMDDVLVDVINIKLENFADRFDAKYRDGFLKLTRSYGVPDIPTLFINGKITLDDILRLKETSSFKVIVEWLRHIIEVRADKESDDIVKDFINEIDKRSKNIGDLPFIKTLRLATAVTASFKLTPLAGAGITLMDSIFFDYFCKKDSPKVFLDEFSELFKE